jgi:hypothetical protein
LPKGARPRRLARRYLSRFTSLVKKITIFALVLLGISPVSATQTASPIDRQAVVTRHDVELSQLDERNALQVGNGNFAFNTDVTGLQTFYGNTFSYWGWHEQPLRGPETGR